MFLLSELIFVVLVILAKSTECFSQGSNNNDQENEGLLPPMFVINLDHHVQRWNRFQGQIRELGLENHSITRIDAINKTGALEMLESGQAALNSTFRDPGNGRRQTLGEVGCVLSHMLAWEHVAQRLQPHQYAIILEDDPNLLETKSLSYGDNLVRHVERVQKTATQMGVDFVYLSYKPLGVQKPPIQWGPQKEELLRPCVFSYWTLAYMLTSSAAQKLLDNLHSLRQNLIPADEMLPIILGTLDDEKDHNNDDDDTCEAAKDPRYSSVRLSCLAVKEPLFFPLNANDGALETSATEVSELVPLSTMDASPSSNKKPIVLSFSHDEESHFGYKTFKRSADFYEYSMFDMYGNDDFSGEEESILQRLYSTLHQGDNTIDQEQLLLFVDVKHSILQQSESVLVERFHQLGADIVFGAEINCPANNKDLCQRYSRGQKQRNEQEDADQLFRHLNGFNFMGKAKDIKRLVATAVQDLPNDDSLHDFFFCKVCRIIGGETRLDYIAGFRLSNISNNGEYETN